MAVSYRAQNISPPSPAFTDPDMILPYTPRHRDYQSPSRTVIPRAVGPDMAVAAQGSSLTPPLSSKTSRPTMPGAWQNEGDLGSALHQNSYKSVPRPIGTNNVSKSSSSKFLYTLDPKLRAGLGVEAPVYSPSIYSPTDSELAQRSPYQEELPKTPIDKSADEPEDLEEAARFRAFLEQNDDDEDDSSLDLRAEEILANAKKRLAVSHKSLIVDLY